MYVPRCYSAALDHIHKCHVDKERREKQVEAMKAKIEELNAAIAHCQEKLPASGVPVTRQVSSPVCMGGSRGGV